jgi:hypothetical protein
MSKRIGIGDGYALAFGFSWQALDPLESTSDKRKEFVEQGKRWEATFRVGKTEYIGVSQDDLTPIPKVKTLAGAAQVAIHPELRGKTVLVVIEEPNAGDGDNEVAVVGLLNGNVVIDDYVTARDFHELAGQFKTRCTRANQPFAVVGRTITLGPVSAELSWNALAPQKPKGIFKRLVAPPNGIKVRSLNTPMSVRVLSVAGVAVVFLGIFWAYDNHQQALKAKELAARQETLHRLPTMYADSVNQLLNSPVLLANSAFGQIRAELREFPTSIAGWRLAKITCEADGTCTATWNNLRKVGTNREFVEAAPKSWGVVQLSNSGETLTHLLPIRLKKHILLDKQRWPDEHAFLLKHFSQWQRYWLLGFHPELESSAHIMGVPSGVDPRAAEAYPTATWATKWAIKNTPWDLSDGFDSAAEKGDGNLPDNVTVEKIAINFGTDNKVLFEAEGQVYARK